MGKPNKSLLSTQHNKLIQARYTMTLQEKRLVLWLISQIEPHDKQFKIYKVPLKALAEYIGVDGNKDFYRRLRDITGRLRTRPIDIEEPDKFLQTTWLSSAEYHFGQDYVALEFSQKLRPYLLQLKSNFTKLQLNIALSLSSIYAIRIYELVKQYEKIQTRRISLTELRHYLSIPDDEYAKYNHFKDKVLHIAQREINTKTDLHIEIEEIKTSRKVTDLCFHITPNPEFKHEKTETLSASVPVEPVHVAPELLKRLRYLGISQQKVLELAGTYGEQTIQVKLQDFEAAVDAGKEIANPAGWLLSAIEKDWNYKSPFQLEQEQKEREEHERQEKERQAAADRAKREAERKAKRLEFDQAIKELFLSRWSALAPVAQAAIISQANFNEAEQRSYSKNGVEKSLVAMLKLQKIVLPEHELNFDKWLEAQTA